MAKVMKWIGMVAKYIVLLILELVVHLDIFVHSTKRFPWNNLCSLGRWIGIFQRSIVVRLHPTFTGYWDASRVRLYHFHMWTSVLGVLSNFKHEKGFWSISHSFWQKGFQRYMPLENIRGWWSSKSLYSPLPSIISTGMTYNLIWIRKNSSVLLQLPLQNMMKRKTRKMEEENQWRFRH